MIFIILLGVCFLVFWLVGMIVFGVGFVCCCVLFLMCFVFWGLLGSC